MGRQGDVSLGDSPHGTSSTASCRLPMQSTVRCTVLTYRSFFWPGIKLGPMMRTLAPVHTCSTKPLPHSIHANMDLRLRCRIPQSRYPVHAKPTAQYPGPGHCKNPIKQRGALHMLKRCRRPASPLISEKIGPRTVPAKTRPKAKKRPLSEAGIILET